MKKYYIKERNNPQIGVYYIACGQLTAKEAKTKESSLYGFNFMHSFNTDKEYLAEINRLQNDGYSVHK